MFNIARGVLLGLGLQLGDHVGDEALDLAEDVGVAWEAINNK